MKTRIADPNAGICVGSFNNESDSIGAWRLGFSQPTILAGFLVFAFYYLGAEIGLSLTYQPYPVSVVWPPNSILLAGLVLTRPRIWWFLFLCAFPAHLIVELHNGVPLAMKALLFLRGCKIPRLMHMLWLFVFAMVGCSSTNVNPHRAASHTGYVDFFDSDENLYWQVDQVSETGKTNQLFSQFSPLQDHILRVALAPGDYQLNVNFLNHVIPEPGSVKVKVDNGLVTPVRVTLAEAGDTTVQTKEASLGGAATYNGRYRRVHAKTLETSSTVFHILLQPEPAIPYQPKNKMPYATGL